MCRSNHCRFDLWAPEQRTKIHNTAFSQYTNSFNLAAMELARHPESQYDEDLQEAICRRYGIFLDSITDDEAEHLSRLVEEYANA